MLQVEILCGSECGQNTTAYMDSFGGGRAAMTAKRWIAACQYFLQPHPELFPAGEKVYCPKDDLTITLWFDGGLQVSGGARSLQLNFNTDEYLVLALREGTRDRIFRVPWDRLVSFEIAIERGSAEMPRQFFLNGRVEPDHT
ncbi:MAG: hypothetical protein ACRCZF_14515 [Gemmataceae bacterium]